MADPLPQPQRAVTKALARLFAMPVGKAIVPIAALLDAAPEPAVTAYMRVKKTLSLSGKDFDSAAAARLDRMTTDLFGQITATR